MTPRTRKTREVPLPPLPTSVFSVHGPVPVILTDDPKILDEGDFGCWNAQDRVIYVRCGMHPTASWLTLLHEQCHADLSDIDFAIANDALEAICNAIAAARLAAIRAGVPRP